MQTLFPTHEHRMQGIAKNGADTQGELFGMGELQEAGRLQAGKATGPDGIPYEVLRVILEIWPELLFEMYNSCLSKGVFPSRWKQQKLVLLRKRKKPRNEPSSYRPICLIDTMGKLLERMLLQRLETHVEERGGLSPRQYGFRKGRSTVDAILEVVNTAKKVKRAIGGREVSAQLSCWMFEIPSTP